MYDGHMIENETKTGGKGMKIETRATDRDHVNHVYIDEVHVGTGSYQQCIALVNELEEDTSGEKAMAVKKCFEEDL